MKRLTLGLTLISMFGLSVSLYGQMATPRILKKPTEATTTSSRRPAILGAQYFSILPHIVDGWQWTTQIVVTNLGTSAETFQIDLYSDNNQSMQFTFGNNIGATATLTGTLAAGQSQVFVTAGGASTVSDGWGLVNSNSGSDISAYEIMRNSIPSYNFASESSVVSTIGIFQNGASLTYDNTNGYASSIAFVNPDNATSTLDAIVYDNAGHQLATHQIQLGAGQKTEFTFPGPWTETANQQGSIYFYPDDPSIQICPITPVAFRFLILPQSQTFVTLPLLQYY